MRRVKAGFVLTAALSTCPAAWGLVLDEPDPYGAALSVSGGLPGYTLVAGSYEYSQSYPGLPTYTETSDYNGSLVQIPSCLEWNGAKYGVAMELFGGFGSGIRTPLLAGSTYSNEPIVSVREVLTSLRAELYLALLRRGGVFLGIGPTFGYMSITIDELIDCIGRSSSAVEIRSTSAGFIRIGGAARFKSWIGRTIGVRASLALLPLGFGDGEISSTCNPYAASRWMLNVRAFSPLLVLEGGIEYRVNRTVGFAGDIGVRVQSVALSKQVSGATNEWTWLLVDVSAVPRVTVVLHL
jgi:hypothetical protein